MVAIVPVIKEVRSKKHCTLELGQGGRSSTLYVRNRGSRAGLSIGGVNSASTIVAKTTSATTSAVIAVVATASLVLSDAGQMVEMRVIVIIFTTTTSTTIAIAIAITIIVIVAKHRRIKKIQLVRASERGIFAWPYCRSVVESTAHITSRVRIETGSGNCFIQF